MVNEWGLLMPTGELVEVNSGGQVLFCFFAPPEQLLFAVERVLIVKFHQSRLMTQSEQFANELTRHLGVCAPNCRILRQQVPSFPSLPHLGAMMHWLYSCSWLCILPSTSHRLPMPRITIHITDDLMMLHLPKVLANCSRP